MRRRESANLHTESTQDQAEEIGNTLTTPEKELFERSSQLFASVTRESNKGQLKVISKPLIR